MVHLNVNLCSIFSFRKFLYENSEHAFIKNTETRDNMYNYFI